MEGATVADCVLSEGSILLERYRIVGVIGEGGFGRVYEARDLAESRPVALKVGRTDEHRGRLLREAQLAGLLKSPHSVRIFGVERLDDGSPLIVMELLRGTSLREFLLMRGKVEPDLALEWTYQIAEALAEAHSLGLVHRDVKPSNLFLEEDERGGRRVKLLDFGLARVPHSADEISLTGSDVVLGSPAYMSPEQIRSGEVSPASDIWSLGVVLYEMLSGRRPFRAESNLGLLAAIAADQPEPLCMSRPGLSPRLFGLVERCLRKDRRERLACIEEFMVVLGECRSQGASPFDSSGSITETLSLKEVRRSWFHARREKIRRASLGFVAAAVFAVPLSFWWRLGNGDMALAASQGALAPPASSSLLTTNHWEESDPGALTPEPVLAPVEETRAAPSARKEQAPGPIAERDPRKGQKTRRSEITPLVADPEPARPAPESTAAPKNGGAQSSRMLFAEPDF